jgi:hypothetical protein
MLTHLKEGKQYSFSIELSSKDILDQNIPEILSAFDKTLTQKKDAELLHITDNTDIPVSVFRNGASGLQAIVSYLKDEKNLSFVEISKLLGRDQRTIWCTYECAKKKKRAAEKNKLNSLENRLKKQKTKNKKQKIIDEPVINSSIFQDRKLSILESAAFSLLKNHSVKEVAGLLGKNQMTIYTVKRRIEQKIGKRGFANA